MHPILFEFNDVTVYSYGFMIALGSIAGVAYMFIRGKKEVGLTFDQANGLFLSIFLAAFVGGKVFLLFEDPDFYMEHSSRLITGRGFVFYGSFLFTIPVMLWYFQKHNLHRYKMLDIMAITTCLVHIIGRLGCFMAGCCYGKPTESLIGVRFIDTACYAEPLHTPLFPTQLLEAVYITLTLSVLLYIRDRRIFYGQLFLLYIILYAVGRGFLEIFRGDLSRGFLIEDYISHSQLIAVALIVVGLFFYGLWSKQNKIHATN